MSASDNQVEAQINPICAPNPAHFWLWIRLSTTWLLSIPLSLELKSSQGPHLWDIFLARIFERRQQSYFLELHFEKTSTYLTLRTQGFRSKGSILLKDQGLFPRARLSSHKSDIWAAEEWLLSVPTAPSCAPGHKGWTTTLLKVPGSLRLPVLLLNIIVVCVT